MENEQHHQTATIEKIHATLDRITEMQEKAALEMKEMREQAALEMKEMREKDTLEAEQRRKDYEQRREEDEQRREEDERRRKAYERNRKEEEKKIDKRMKELHSLFTSQWGALMESLVEGDLVPVLQKRNITVLHTVTRVYGRRNGEHFEFDILAVNGEEVVVVEVKTTLRAKDVKHFLQKLDRFTVYAPVYQGKKIYGAVAFLKADKSVQAHAERQGLFVIRATGSSASIVNDTEFVPRVF